MKRFFIFVLYLTGANFVFAEWVATFPNLNRPHQIGVDNDQLYIIDDATISIYSLMDFKRMEIVKKK